MSAFGFAAFQPKVAIDLFQVMSDSLQGHTVMGNGRVFPAGLVSACEQHRFLKASELVNDVFEFHATPFKK